MTKYVWDKEKKDFVKVEPGYRPRHPSSGPYFMPDIAPFRSFVDGSYVSSRPQLEEHNKRNNVIDAGDLKTVRDFDHSIHKPFKSVIED